MGGKTRALFCKLNRLQNKEKVSVYILCDVWVVLKQNKADIEEL